jgi:hypothetical protein
VELETIQHQHQHPGSPSGQRGTSGSPSIFSSITSAGGGGGVGGMHHHQDLQYRFRYTRWIWRWWRRCKDNGGTRIAGTGNTPPVSPPQGNDGGISVTPGVAGAGGGVVQEV